MASSATMAPVVEALQIAPDDRAGHVAAVGPVHPPALAGHFHSGDWPADHPPEIPLGRLVGVRPAEELITADAVHARQARGRQDRVVQHRRVAESGEHLRVRADQRVVKQVYQVGSTGPAGRGHD
jgi:hypothetical protein